MANPIDFKPIDFQPESAPPEEMSALEAGARGVGQDLSFGLLPQLLAGGKKILNPSTPYAQLLAKQQESQEQAAKDQPAAYYSGMLGSAAVSTPAIEALSGGMASVPEAAKLASMMKAYNAIKKSGTAAGALAGAGAGASDLSQGNIGEGLLKSGLGVAGGAVLGKAAGALGDKLSSEGLQKTSSEIASKIGKVSPVLEDFRDVGQTLMDKNVFRNGTGIAAVKSTAQQDAASVAQQAKQALIDSQGKISQDTALGLESDLQKSIAAIKNQASSKFSGLSPSVKDPIIQPLNAALDHYEAVIKDAGSDPVKLFGIKQDLYNEIGILNQNAYDPVTRQVNTDKAVPYLQGIAQSVKDFTEKYANAAQAGLGDQMANLNKQYGDLVSVGGAIKNSGSGIANAIMGAAAAARGNAIGVGKSLMKAGSASGDAMLPVAKGARAVGKALEKVPSAISGGGAKSLLPGIGRDVGAEPAQKVIEGPSAVPVMPEGDSNTSARQSRDISNQTPEELRDTSDKVKQIAPELHSQMDKLDQAIESKNFGSTNAKLNALMQQPQFRMALNKLKDLPEDESDNA